MIKENQKNQNHDQTNNVSGMATGVFIGGLLGALTMLFFAPQSGQKTRAQIQQKTLELRARALELVQDTVSQVQVESKRLTQTAQDKATEMIHQGQDMVADQLAHASKAVETNKQSMAGS
jgi:gas vesicle protein